MIDLKDNLIFSNKLGIVTFLRINPLIVSDLTGYVGWNQIYLDDAHLVTFRIHFSVDSQDKF